MHGFKFEREFPHPEDMTVVLTMDDDTEMECAIVALFSVQGREYIALMSTDIEDEEVILYRLIYNSINDFKLENIEDEEEYDLAATAFDELEYYQEDNE